MLFRQPAVLDSFDVVAVMRGGQTKSQLTIEHTMRLTTRWVSGSHTSQQHVASHTIYQPSYFKTSYTTVNITFYRFYKTFQSFHWLLKCSRIVVYKQDMLALECLPKPILTVYIMLYTPLNISYMRVDSIFQTSRFFSQFWTSRYYCKNELKSSVLLNFYFYPLARGVLYFNQIPIFLRFKRFLNICEKIFSM